MTDPDRSRDPPLDPAPVRAQDPVQKRFNVIEKQDVLEPLRDFLGQNSERNWDAWISGGWVRDTIMGLRKSRDFDLVVYRITAPDFALLLQQYFETRYPSHKPPKRRVWKMAGTASTAQGRQVNRPARRQEIEIAQVQIEHLKFVYDICAFHGSPATNRYVKPVRVPIPETIRQRQGKNSGKKNVFLGESETGDDLFDVLQSESGAKSIDTPVQENPLEATPGEMTTAQITPAENSEAEIQEDGFSRILLADAMRRDFTINSLYYHPERGEILDPLNSGLEDIENRILRLSNIRNPESTLIEDPIRVIRAAAVMSRGQRFMMSQRCRQAMFNPQIYSLAVNPDTAPKERFHAEMVKLLKEIDFSTGLRILAQFPGMLDRAKECFQAKSNNDWCRRQQVEFAQNLHQETIVSTSDDDLLQEGDGFDEGDGCDEGDGSDEAAVIDGAVIPDGILRPDGLDNAVPVEAVVPEGGG